jgi:hypothetical protein
MLWSLEIGTANLRAIYISPNYYIMSGRCLTAGQTVKKPHRHSNGSESRCLAYNPHLQNLTEASAVISANSAGFRLPYGK